MQLIVAGAGTCPRFSCFLALDRSTEILWLEIGALHGVRFLPTERKMKAPTSRSTPNSTTLKRMYLLTLSGQRAFRANLQLK